MGTKEVPHFRGPRKGLKRLKPHNKQACDSSACQLTLRSSGSSKVTSKLSTPTGRLDYKEHQPKIRNKYAHQSALYLLTLMIQQDKIKLPKETNHKPRTPSDHIQSKPAQPCELPPLLHKLTYNPKMTTHTREKRH